MKVILTTNIKKLGKVGDLVNVKDGFARNYLFANNMALRETKSNIEHFEKIKGEIGVKENQKYEKAKILLDSVKKLKIEFVKEADDKDQLYGAVSKKEILNFLADNDIKLLSDDLKILQPIRNIGVHQIEINPYEGLIEELQVSVKKT